MVLRTDMQLMIIHYKHTKKLNLTQHIMRHDFQSQGDNQWIAILV